MIEYRVFIGWSGSYCQRLANAVENAILYTFDQKIRPFIADPEDTHGVAWLRRLQKGIHESHAAVFILAPEVQNSWWVPFELGMWSEKLKRGADGGHDLLTFPFRLSQLSPQVELALPETVNFLALKSNTFLDMLKRLSNVSAHKPAFALREESEEFRNEVWRPLERVMEEGQEEFRQQTAIEESRSQLLTLFEQRRPGPIGSEKFVEAVRNFAAAEAVSQELAAAFLELLKQTSGCVRELFGPEDDQWLEQEASQIISVVRRAANTLREIKNGELVVFKEDNLKNFYKKNVIDLVQKSMWTTNFSNYDGSFGRTMEPDILKSHKKACDRGAVIQRVFAVRDTIDEQTAVALTSVIKAQADVGVETFVIRLSVLLSLLAENGDARRIGSPDLMILDKKRVYVTQLELSERVTGVRLLRGDDVVAAAESVRRSVMDEAIRVTQSDVEEIIAKLAT